MRMDDLDKGCESMDGAILDKGYEPKDVESRWYSYWQKEGLFVAQDASGKPPYSIVIPPPNVTGVLHMGHAHNNTIQDILCRFRRMQGFNVLWMPGTDHAGIATQNVVEKELAREGTDRHALGREQFVERVWQWREKCGGAIIGQLKRLGASCDWDRERFTMDEGLSKAVRTVFVRLYSEGLIYQGNYIINWCPRCQTALSDLEVEHEEHKGSLYHIRYHFEDGGAGVVIATTRPETMLGDTAVAVNPNDDRYLGARGLKVVLPIMNKPIVLIMDEYVDMKFGTGALKITPAHDPNDFEIGKRHGLDSISVIDAQGRMNENAGRFQGMDRFECRKAIVEELQLSGLLEKIEPYDHKVGHCYRCRTTVEPYLSKQWFVKVKPLAQRAMEAVQTGKTRIVPEIWTKTYFEWMSNIRDWCISRQIWWGHRIPAWTCATCGHLMVQMDPPAKCMACESCDLSQETDVLDTWFSSALWPFSTMGWPDGTQALKTFYPTSVLVTGFDILFFWVARMMMMGLHFMDEVPFKDVYIHALVRDADGKKMSKSKGNVIDPLYVIDKFGTDAFRFTLAAFAAQGRDIKLSEDRIEGYRHFINKLWNASRFSLMHLAGFEPENAGLRSFRLSLADRWILSRLNVTIQLVTKSLEEYRFNDGASALYKFIWNEFCDWYLEMAKPVLFRHEDAKAKAQTGVQSTSISDDDADYKAARFVIWTVLNSVLRLLHPFTPFVTEEIWHKLPAAKGSIMKASFPACNDQWLDVEAEATMQTVMDVTGSIRTIRGELNVPPSLKADCSVQCGGEKAREILKAHADTIVRLAGLRTLSIQPLGERQPYCATALFSEGIIFVALKDIMDLDAEKARLSKELAKLQADLSFFEKKLNNKEFMDKAPAEVVEENREKQDAAIKKAQRVRELLDTVLRIAEGK